MIPVLIPPSPPEPQSKSPQDVIFSLKDKIVLGREEITERDLQLLRKALHEISQNGDSLTVPYLDRTFLQSVPKNITLVRYVGMVQDVLDTEYYATTVDGVNMKYRDYSSHASEDVVQDMERFGERHPMVIVPVPFANTKLVDSISKWTSRDTSRSTTATIGYESGNRNPKRLAQETDFETTTSGQRAKVTDNSSSSHTQRQSASTPPCSNDNDDFWPAGTMGSDRTQCAILAKFYSEDWNQRSLRLNQLVEIVGVHYHKNLVEKENVQEERGNHTMYNNSWDMDVDLFDKVQNQLPHVHVLDCTCVNIYSESDPRSDFSSDFEIERSFAIQTFSSYIFGGNIHVSEALLMCLMSMAERDMKEQRPIHLPSGKTLGCLSLRLFAPTLEACCLIRTRLYTILKAIMPVVACLDLTAQNLESETNSNLCTPEKRCRLRPSSMQLPQGSCILVDDSKINVNCRNIDSRVLNGLSRIARDHSISYRFNGIDFDFEADYIVIVVSLEETMEVEESEIIGDETAFSDCTLQCHLKSVCIPSAYVPLPEDVVSRISSYLRSCRTYDRISLSDRALLMKAQNDFIERRNLNMLPVNEDDFHRWLTLTRLCARSRAKTLATTGDWESSLFLDDTIRSIAQKKYGTAGTSNI